MFAVFEDGSHQYKVRSGDLLVVDLRSEAQNGQSITFDRVLLANNGGETRFGRPTIEGAKIVGEVVNPRYMGIKLEIQHHHRRNASRKHTGHRQKYTQVKISEISVPGLAASSAEASPSAT